MDVFENGVEFVLLYQFVDRVFDWGTVLITTGRVLVSSRIHALEDSLLKFFNLCLREIAEHQTFGIEVVGTGSVRWLASGIVETQKLVQLFCCWLLCLGILLLYFLLDTL